MVSFDTGVGVGRLGRVPRRSTCPTQKSQNFKALMRTVDEERHISGNEIGFVERMWDDGLASSCIAL